MLTLAPVNFHPNWQCRRLDASLQLGIGFIYERLIAIMLPPTAVLAHHGIYESILATSPPPSNSDYAIGGAQRHRGFSCFSSTRMRTGALPEYHACFLPIPSRSWSGLTRPHAAPCPVYIPLRSAA